MRASGVKVATDQRDAKPMVVPKLHSGRPSSPKLKLRGSAIQLNQLRVDIISGDLTDFSSTNGGVLAVKGTKKLDESHVDLTRDCGMSPVTMNTVLHRVYLTWKHPRRQIE